MMPNPSPPDKKAKVVTTVTTNVPSTKEGKDQKLEAKLYDSGQVAVRPVGLIRPVLIDELRAGLGRLASALEPGNL